MGVFFQKSDETCHVKFRQTVIDGARHQLINHHDFVVTKSNESLNVNKL